MEKQITVAVDYREEDGWHMFFSKEIVGLFVAGPDRVKAYNQVPAVLEKLARLNDGQSCSYSPVISAEDFFQKRDKRRLIPFLQRPPAQFEPSCDSYAIA